MSARKSLTSRLSMPGQMTPVGWKLPQRMSYENWVRCGQALTQMAGTIQWALGDWWVYGEHSYGERVAALRDGAFGGYAFQTLMDYGSVARRVRTSIRIEVLTFRHHQVVAALPPAQQKRWLQKAVQGDLDESGQRSPWSVDRLRNEIKVTQRAEEEEFSGRRRTPTFGRSINGSVRSDLWHNRSDELFGVHVVGRKRAVAARLYEFGRRHLSEKPTDLLKAILALSTLLPNNRHWPDEGQPKKFGLLLQYLFGHEMVERFLQDLCQRPLEQHEASIERLMREALEAHRAAEGVTAEVIEAANVPH